MPAELVADAERAFEIDRGSLMPAAERRAGERFGRGLDRERALPDGNDRQARSGAGDRGAERDSRGVPGRRDLEPGVAAPFDGVDAPDIGDYSGEQRCQTSQVSPPASRRA